MPVTLPYCNGVDIYVDRYDFESPDTCPTFREHFIGDGDRRDPPIANEVRCHSVWWDYWRGYYTRWSPYIDDPLMRTFYTLSEE